MSRRNTELLLLIASAFPVILLYAMYVLTAGAAISFETLAGETSNPRHRRRPACRSCIEKVPGLPRLPYCYTDAYENSTRYGTDDLQETTSANLMNGHPFS